MNHSVVLAEIEHFSVLVGEGGGECKIFNEPTKSFASVREM